MNVTRIVLADDHHVVRQALRDVLEAKPDFSVIGEAEDGLEAVQLVERLQPDVLVLDLMMPGLNGLEVTRKVSQDSPETRVIIVSMCASQAYVLQALRRGAGGYVLKASSADDLTKAVCEVVAGRRYISPPLSEGAIESYTEKAKGAPLDLYDTLTTREREVLHLAAEGHTNAEIGDRLHCGLCTVKVHRASMMRKLGLRTQADLIRYVLQRGIIPM